MSNATSFDEIIRPAYTFEGDTLTLGGAMYGKTVHPGLHIRIPLRTLNRHGLIAGATGTGKTKSLQLLAEQLSLNSVPCLLMDIKGDLSGIAAQGSTNPKIEARYQQLGLKYELRQNPVELLTLSGEAGIRLRATVTEFGPVLFSKVLDLNDTQSGAVSLVFKYCDDKKLPLVDLKDFKKVLQFIANEGKAEVEKEFGQVSQATVGTIIRKVLELEQQGAEAFFGEPSFDVEDLVRIDPNTGQGVISIIRLTDIQDRPKLFSTFMLSLLAEIYSTFPEMGDADRPKLCVFIDEAHLVFEEASDALLDQLEAIIKLIRSKGVGIYFITQNPADLPNDILGQLGLKIQHALRAFTAKDRKDIKLAAENYPESAFYPLADDLTELGIGEAFVTALNPKGIPTPVVHTLMCAPGSRMDVLTPDEIGDIVARSPLAPKYNREIDPQSAFEILTAKIEAAQTEAQQAELRKQQEKAAATSTRRNGGREEKSVFQQVIESKTTQSIVRSVVKEVTRGLLGVLGLGGRKR